MSNREIELLLSGEQTGSEDLAGLESFVAALAKAPTPPHDVSHMATALAATARTTVHPPLRFRFRRLVSLGATLAVLMGLSGVALAADSAVPGDLLYGLDRALESVGLGAEGIAERQAEFNVLLQRGDEEKAFSFMEAEIKKASPNDAAEARSHLETARNDLVVVTVPTPDPVEKASEPEPAVAPSPDTDARSENTPPGQEIIPPGQENTPPGQENTPPGQENTPPGQENTPPGQENTPPGQENTPPGQESTPPGQTKAPPGQENTPPGQETTPSGPAEGSNSSVGPSSDGNQGSNGSHASSNNGNTDPGTQGQANGHKQGNGQNQGKAQGQNQG